MTPNLEHFLPAVINHQSSINSHHSSIINHPSSAINHHSSTSNYQTSVIRNQWTIPTIRHPLCSREWGDFGVTLGWCWNQFAIIFGSFWDHFGSPWDHFGVTLGSLWDHFGFILEYLPKNNGPRRPLPVRFLMAAIIFVRIPHHPKAIKRKLKAPPPAAWIEIYHSDTLKAQGNPKT